MALGLNPAPPGPPKRMAEQVPDSYSTHPRTASDQLQNSRTLPTDPPYRIKISCFSRMGLAGQEAKRSSEDGVLASTVSSSEGCGDEASIPRQRQVKREALVEESAAAGRSSGGMARQASQGGRHTYLRSQAYKAPGVAVPRP
ncbi:hypothetical protein AAFF_G00417350 [Aldrovandia affinis]|uniref:Uncharacterized protein n=1 Tax=Aldrovandia affinis TaxID=143900 RepID=A0AAD7VYK3_9TELE|nr:hypothetical protein AAFF_G00417350 [Aldrovandia affinis]